MKEYDFETAHRYIEDNADNISIATLGISEDWFWTAERVFEDGKFLIDLTVDDVKIGGINGSDWTTPVMAVEYKDGTEKIADCYIGVSTDDRPPFFIESLGVLSQPAQEDFDKRKNK